MPPQKKSSGLSAKLGARLVKAHETHKADPTNFGQMDLPEMEGIAQLVDIGFGTYKEGKHKGEFFFKAAGIVVTPDKVGDMPVQGLRTQIGPEPLCDTPESSGKKKTLDDHYAWILNELRKLGVATDEISFDDLESTCEALKETKPYFRFRVWKGKKTEIIPVGGGKVKVGEKVYPNEAAAKAANPYAGSEPRANHDWKGVCDYATDGSEGDGVQEDAGTTEEATSQVDAAYVKALAVKADKKKDENAQRELEALALRYQVDSENLPDWTAVANAIIEASKNDPQEAGGEEAPEEAAEEEATEEATEEAEGESIDYVALGEAADSGDSEAMETLTALATEGGLDPDEYPTWTELATVLQPQEEGGEEEAAEEPWKPAAKEVYYYKPTVIDPKTKKPAKAKKGVECEVTAVDEAAETVALKNMDNPKVLYKNVKWTDLSNEA